ncbi:Glyoxalase superfamily enzyme, possibly 3-demethylubiquinone-9 3-methyltransferase [Sanguibacter gelidistatuariae]|uniref:Glyoxalase superfamily enzyme, possibly 3-demethylubiquinone-9 3-methyltransferase n=1 Tax=Sanguibacter gelidistatuariae TaxID=1814289 RepID=A0A1G6HZ52_9MICO|nr:VOC family protein [Sanguibacter gelidistatuariae]SDB98756.1 Glyoxalase superfamily enzyme, possibly 3-demethylubiquinone-9 3-methyltransferase [Sanguibacter gelidistatuariae]
MNSIVPCLWFADQAEDAANLYVSIFKNSSIVNTSRYGEGAPVPAGTALMVDFILDGTRMQALNGGEDFPFTAAISLSVAAQDQEEVDHLWDSLIADGGEPGQCGWLKDKFGLSWQVVPSVLGTLMGGSDPVKGNRVMQALMGMTKLSVAELQAAYDG